MKLERDLLRQVINLVAIVAAFGTNVAANLAPTHGKNQRTSRNKIPPLIEITMIFLKLCQFG